MYFYICWYMCSDIYRYMNRDIDRDIYRNKYRNIYKDTDNDIYAYVYIYIYLYIYIYVYIDIYIYIHILLCQSSVTLGFWAKTQNEPTHIWFFPKFPSGLLQLKNRVRVVLDLFSNFKWVTSSVIFGEPPGHVITLGEPFLLSRTGDIRWTQHPFKMLNKGQKKHWFQPVKNTRLTTNPCVRPKRLPVCRHNAHMCFNVVPVHTGLSVCLFSKIANHKRWKVQNSKLNSFQKNLVIIFPPWYHICQEQNFLVFVRQ